MVRFLKVSLGRKERGGAISGCYHACSTAAFRIRQERKGMGEEGGGLERREKVVVAARAENKGMRRGGESRGGSGYVEKRERKVWRERSKYGWVIDYDNHVVAAAAPPSFLLPMTTSVLLSIHLSILPPREKNDNLSHFWLLFTVFI